MRCFYKVGGAAALITAVLVPLQLWVFIAWPPPFGGPVTQWFDLFRSSWLLGLLSLDLLFLIDYALLIPIVLALYVALKRSSEFLTVTGAALFFVGIAAYFASNTAFEMLSLSNQYAAATTAAQKAGLVAAGQVMLATYQGTAFQVSYILGSLAGILLSVAMLRSGAFSRLAAHAGIWGNVVGFGLYLPKVGLAISAASGLVLWVWYILLGRDLLKLGRNTDSSLHPRGAEAAG